MTSALLAEADFRSALQALLPRGAAWPRHEDATLTQFLGALAARHAALHARVGDLSERESLPPVADELLPDWERAFGLPDPCMPATATLAQRRAALVARIVERLAPTPATIIAIADLLGDQVTVTEYRPHDCDHDCEAPALDEAWAHAFLVTGTTDVISDFTCEDQCEVPLRQWQSGIYECAIRRMAPAHTVPLFAYA